MLRRGLEMATNLCSDCFVSSSYSARLVFRTVGNHAAFHPLTSLGRYGFETAKPSSNTNINEGAHP
jgi:hypothetical protein